MNVTEQRAHLKNSVVYQWPLGFRNGGRRPHGETVTTLTIVTTEPNSMMSAIHDRMPVVLQPIDYAAWLEADDPKDLLKPAHNERLFAYPVGAAVGKVSNNDPSLIQPVEESDRRYLAALQ